MYRKYGILFYWTVLVVVMIGCASACSSVRPASPTPLPASSQLTITVTPRLASATPSPTRLKPTPTRTVTLTRTLRPTATATPSPTAAFTPLPADAISPSPFFTPAFPSTVNLSYDAGTHTPIATPPSGSYRLKEWSEADGLALIRYLNQTAYDEDFPSAGDFRDQFLVYQQATNLAVREFLLRYPNSLDREQAEWLLAFTNTLDRRDSDEWLIAEIDRRINAGWLNPADLKSGLEPLGFVANPAYFRFDQELSLKPIWNLFGDDLPAHIWEIQNAQEAYYGHKMYLAIEQLADGSFRVVRIYSKHNFPYSGGPLIEARDLTGEGQPELIINDVGCEFGCNNMNVSIYQWQQDRFVELSHGNFGSEDDMGGDITWEFGEDSQNGSTVINVTEAMLGSVRHSRLIWNGEWFQIAERRMELPRTDFLVDDIFHSWIGYAMEFGEFDNIQPLFQFLLENPPENQGPAYLDFVHFQMAMVDAFSSRVGTARQQLQQIVDSPADPAKPLVASAAAAFLQNYQGDVDIFRSCQAALSVMDHNLKSLRNANPEINPEVISEQWGFLPSSSLCNPRAAFRFLIRSLDLKSGEDVTTRLGEVGVPVLRSLKADFDGDTIPDWLVVVDTPASERTVEAWVFVDTGQGYSAVPVFDYQPHYPSYAIGVSNNPIRVNLFPFPGDRQPGIVLQAGEQLAIFTVHHQDFTAEVELLQIINQVKSFQIDPQVNELSLTYLPGAYDAYFDTLAWRDELDSFLYLNQAEKLLFEEKNPAGSVRAIQAELPNLNPNSYAYPSEAPRLYYLLGLAYELQGNLPAAVDAYLKVWREFPGSAYALMVREKIE